MLLDLLTKYTYVMPIHLSVMNVLNVKVVWIRNTLPRLLTDIVSYCLQV